MLPDSHTVALALAHLPVAAVLIDARGKLLETTPLAATLLRRQPDLVARIAALATLAIGSRDTLRRGDETLELTVVGDLTAEHDDWRVVFVTRHETGEPLDDPLAVLTTRQREAALLAASGLHDTEIATRLGCRTRTVRAHLSASYRQLGVRSRTELAALIGASHGGIGGSGWPFGQ